MFICILHLCTLYESIHNCFAIVFHCKIQLITILLIFLTSFGSKYVKKSIFCKFQFENVSIDTVHTFFPIFNKTIYIFIIYMVSQVFNT